jgi:hypothetical protein
MGSPECILIIFWCVTSGDSGVDFMMERKAWIMILIENDGLTGH